ncbi:M20 family metallo-hydrolase [Flavitalea sp. BT771]|uniref:M20 family metallo-hydrolase n=1 Tax=Flavitalea sp. BT771 TaxID=3063329 RepID=UPI0026E3D980|nr:M20 family metallo-hydrolase [Flavitalea sp. BT771]MDO6433838.1 M20 family metallo-hydrolase [Flavitalea sp. BT771]MDV6222257.1 M20 family metallo-hydrolase [Flavitalea sp. BT771]
MLDSAIHTLQAEAIDLLRQLIAIPSFSKEEDKTAALLEQFLRGKGISTERIQNNIWAKNKFFDPAKPTLLLNSHHDTVKPNKAYTLDPFSPIEKDGKLYGLGSNDAGGPLVSLIAAFIYFYGQKDLTHNILLAATAEEEISGHQGIELLIPYLGKVDWGVVGEPTQMQLAVAEKGLLVLDCTVQGRAGHAAREEGENAIYKAMPDIEWFRTYRFPKVSDLLGPVKTSVTVIHTDNKAHNVVPSTCHFVVDVRVNELYTFEEILGVIREHVSCDVQPRSLRMRSSSISMEHPVVQAGVRAGRKCYGSPTTSDKALMPFPTLKTGPGDSARSHTADEYIRLDEIKEGITSYIELLKPLL